MSRSKHHGCGKSCSLCKPWKHGFEDPLKPSERRELQDDIDAEAEEYLACRDHCTDGDCDRCRGYFDNVVTLTERDWEVIQSILQDPPKASEELKARYRKYKDML